MIVEKITFIRRKTLKQSTARAAYAALFVLRWGYIRPCGLRIPQLSRRARERSLQQKHVRSRLQVIRKGAAHRDDGKGLHRNAELREQQRIDGKPAARNRGHGKRENRHERKQYKQHHACDGYGIALHDAQKHNYLKSGGAAGAQEQPYG